MVNLPPNQGMSYKMKTDIYHINKFTTIVAKKQMQSFSAGDKLAHFLVFYLCNGEINRIGSHSFQQRRIGGRCKCKYHFLGFVCWFLTSDRQSSWGRHSVLSLDFDIIIQTGLYSVSHHLSWLGVSLHFTPRSVEYFNFMETCYENKRG